MLLRLVEGTKLKLRLREKDLKLVIHVEHIVDHTAHSKSLLTLLALVQNYQPRHQLSFEHLANEDVRVSLVYLHRWHFGYYVQGNWFVLDDDHHLEHVTLLPVLMKAKAEMCDLTPFIQQHI